MVDRLPSALCRPGQVCARDVRRECQVLQQGHQGRVRLPAHNTQLVKKTLVWRSIWGLDPSKSSLSLEEHLGA